MARLRSNISAIGALVAAIAMCVPPLLGRARSFDSPRQQQIDAIFGSAIKHDDPGASVLVRKDGQTVFERGYGIRDLASRTKIDAATNFRLASCTKQFTAMAIMLLVHDGKLTYDTPLTNIFPEFPAYAKTITIRNLLNHTSGLPDYEDLMDAVEHTHDNHVWTDIRQIQDSQVLALLERGWDVTPAPQHGKFQPGTRWAYSNSGYVLLGAIVAKVSGKSYPEFLSDRIFQPLGMQNTIAYVKGKNEVTNRAYGNSQVNGAWQQTDQSSTSATLGDGGIYSSLNDLAKWDDALANYALLSASEITPALTPVNVPHAAAPAADSDANALVPAGHLAAYGFGWFLDPYKGHPRMWHDGETMGFRTTIQLLTADHLTIIVLSNRADFDSDAFALKVADLFLLPQTSAENRGRVPIGQPKSPAWLQRMVASIGGGGLFVVTFFDSSVLSFPFVADALLIDLSINRAARMPFYAAMAALGSLAGCIWLYLLAKKGGEVWFHRRAGRRALKARQWVDRNAFLSVFIPAILPPPFPFKIFILAEGVFQVPLRTFVFALLLGRGLRYFAEGFFGVKYGSQSLIFLTTHGPAFAIATFFILGLLFVASRLLLHHSPESE